MLWNAFLLAMREIRRNVMRSFLTMLGIVIGVAAVITMVTIGGGATVQVTAQIESLGSNLLIVTTSLGFGPGGVRTGAPFDMADAEAIGEQIGSIEAVAPQSAAAVTAIYGNENWATTVSGVTNGYFPVRHWPLTDGRIFTGAEQRAGPFSVPPTRQLSSGPRRPGSVTAAPDRAGTHGAGSRDWVIGAAVVGIWTMVLARPRPEDLEALLSG